MASKWQKWFDEHGHKQPDAVASPAGIVKAKPQPRPPRRVVGEFIAWLDQTQPVFTEPQSTDLGPDATAWTEEQGLQ